MSEVIEGKGLGLVKCCLYREDGDFLVTSKYGPRNNPVSGEYQYHSGIDGVRLFKGAHDIATITAAEDGDVIDVCDWVEGVDTKVFRSGNYVRIHHASGRETMYLHLRYGSIPSNIKPGSKVKKGQTIGIMGNTGNSTGAHLHFQVYDVDGRTIIDPTPFVLGKNINCTDEGDDGMFIKVTPCKYTDRGENVKDLQKKLCQLSADIEKEVKGHSLDCNGNFDGIFGRGLESTIKKLQEAAGMKITGVCDDAFCEMLNKNQVDLTGIVNTIKNIVC